jgi:hypothetical protein
MRVTRGPSVLICIYLKFINDYFYIPRDKSKYTLSPMGQQQQQQNVSKGVVIPPEPNVDFEFHVKIFIKGGKCVLHTSKGSTEEEKRKMKKDKSFTGKKINLFHGLF